MHRRAACLILAAVALGCREPSNSTVATCVDQCDTAGDCPGGTGDCVDICEAQFDEAERIGCVLEYERILECVGALATVCDPSPCGTELSDYTICLGAFCAQDRGFAIGKDALDSSCPQPGGTGGGS